MKKHSITHYLKKNPKKTPLRCMAFALAAVLMISALVLPVPASAKSLDTISVGLYFVNNALESANLQNVTGYGSGYELGLYDLDENGDYKQFVALAQTDVVDISMLIDRTQYFSGSGYTTSASSGLMVGAYHLELVYSYDSYQQARDTAMLYDGGFVAYSYGKYFVRFGSYATYADAQAESGLYADCTVTGESEYGITVVQTSTGRILFELDEGAGTNLGVKPLGSGETRTWFKGKQYNGSFRYDRPEGEAMHVANLLPLEQYVAAVLCREFGFSWPEEAMKAGACCIRTFAMTGDKHRTFDVCNSTCCQVYEGVHDGSQWEYILQLCEATAGECIYYDNQPILAVFHSSNGGATSSSADTWTMDYPYLQGVYDPFESLVSTGAKNWSATYSLSELTELAQIWGFQCSAITEVYVSEYSEQGNVNAVTFVDANGTSHTFTGEDTTMFRSSAYNGSRRYVIIPPWGSAEVSDVKIGEEGTPGSDSNAQGSSEAGEFLVYDGVSTTAHTTISVLTASGPVTVSGEAQILRAETAQSSPGAETSTYPSVVLTTRTITNDTGDYMVYGSGWGHNVGLSAYGAYAMAQQGYSYTEILLYYYRGVSIR